MFGSALHAAQVATGFGVGAGGGVGRAGPPHLPESAQFWQSQSTGLEHVAVDSVQPEAGSPGAKHPGGLAFQHHCMLSCATHASHVVAGVGVGAGAGGGVGTGPGPPHAPESAQSEQSQSTGLEHVAVDSLQPEEASPGAKQPGTGLPFQHHCMLSCATHAPHVVAGVGVGAGGAGGGVGTGPGPPHAPESAQSEHPQSTVMLHVERGRLQPSPGLRQ